VIHLEYLGEADGSLFLLQAMAALASSKEADWNAMRLRLVLKIFTAIILCKKIAVCQCTILL
jgi:hypothetical protein